VFNAFCWEIRFAQTCGIFDQLIMYLGCTDCVLLQLKYYDEWPPVNDVHWKYDGIFTLSTYSTGRMNCISAS